MAVLNQGHTKAIELNLSKQTCGNALWQKAYNLPEFGVSLMMFDLANPTMLGTGISLFPNIDFTLTKNKIHQKPFIEWRLKFGYGIGYLSKIFDRENNFKNIAIGSHLNAFIHLNNHIVAKINEHWMCSAGISFSHFSNGAFKTPNLGINVPAANMGIIYYFNPVSKSRKDSVVFNFKDDLSCSIKKEYNLITCDTVNGIKKIENLLVTSGGLKEITPYYGPKYGTFNIRYAKIYRHSFKSTFGLGAEINYNRANSILYQRVYEKNNPLSAWQAGITFQYYLMLGNTNLYFHFGTYLYNNYKELSLFYHRIGGIHKIYKNWYFNLSLRTHFAVADNIEWGIAYKW
jgi:hypothetical protein